MSFLKNHKVTILCTIFSVAITWAITSFYLDDAVYARGLSDGFDQAELICVQKIQPETISEKAEEVCQAKLAGNKERCSSQIRARDDIVTELRGRLNVIENSLAQQAFDVLMDRLEEEAAKARIFAQQGGDPGLQNIENLKESLRVLLKHFSEAEDEYSNVAKAFNSDIKRLLSDLDSLNHYDLRGRLEALVEQRKYRALQISNATIAIQGIVAGRK